MFGFHTSLEYLKIADKKGLYQIFIDSPQRFPDLKKITQVKSLLDSFSKENVFIHISYPVTINKFGILKKYLGLDKYLVVHPNCITPKTPLERYSLLVDLCKYSHPNILIENQFNKKSLCSELYELIILSRISNFNFCIDLNHLYHNDSSFDLLDFFSLFFAYIGKNRLKLVHLNDYSEETKSKHLEISQGIIFKTKRNLSLICLLLKEYKIPFIIERGVIIEPNKNKELKYLSSILEKTVLYSSLKTKLVYQTYYYLLKYFRDNSSNVYKGLAYHKRIKLLKQKDKIEINPLYTQILETLDTTKERNDLIKGLKLNVIPKPFNTQQTVWLLFPNLKNLALSPPKYIYQEYLFDKSNYEIMGSFKDYPSYLIIKDVDLLILQTEKLKKQYKIVKKQVKYKGYILYFDYFIVNQIEPKWFLTKWDKIMLSQNKINT